MRALFAQFGPISDVVSRRTHKLRGQAWVVFEAADDAAKAVAGMQGFPFFGKPIRVSLARTVSDATKRQEGVFDEGEAEARRAARRAARAAAAAPAEAPAEAAPGAADLGRRSLLAENLPDAANEAMLTLVFQQFPGFRAARLEGRGAARVEFDSAAGAAAALDGLQGFRLATDKPMQLRIVAEGG
jgi:U2 small nuclear ribonucleoprotein B''